jgi:myxalamid-type polyketide synthase MxaC
VSDQTNPPDRRALLHNALQKLQEMQARVDQLERTRIEPIAIIGLGCRFPGGVDDPDRYWALLRDGVSAVREVPPDRWDVDAYYDPDPEAPGKSYTRFGGFLDQIDRFDPQFFGISPREAVTLDPQQRLVLEVGWEALEHAGEAAPARLRGSRTGVFVGAGSSDYAQLQMSVGVEGIDAYTGSGAGLCFVAGRLSYCLGLQGPSLSVDTACSSSLVAVHLACQSLRASECDMALAGGVNIIAKPDLFVYLSKVKALAADGRSKVFDAAADGFVRGEGCGMIVLKRLSNALADGDTVLAVIRGSAVNQDGASSGLTVPNGPAQQAVITEALARGRVSAGDIDYIEAHGTGTALGDPIEIGALVGALASNRSADRPVMLASVKTNLGHLEAAAGIAGLIKVVLALQHGEIPPHLHFQRLNPAISFGSVPFVIPTTRRPWPAAERRRLAGISSFGLSGTNAHVVVEEAPAVAAPLPTSDRPLHLLALSARGAKALNDLAARYAQHVQRHPELSLADVCFTANAGRAHFGHRVAIVAATTEQLRERLEAFGANQSDDVATGIVELARRPKVAFLFTGQGAQYAGMGRGLYDTQPVFRRVIDHLAELLGDELEPPLLEVLFPSSANEHLINETRFAQPALFAVEYALAELWRSWGVEPAALLGHSVGEYAAACVAGVMSVEDAAKLVAARGRLMQALPRGGAMAAVFAAEPEVRSRARSVADSLTIAAVNGPEETVVSGDADMIDRLIERSAADGIKARRLEVSHAFHSARLDPMLDEFERVAASLTYSAPRIPLISNLTGTVFPSGTRPDASYWRRHARETVLFADAVAALHSLGATVLLEIGPHPTLLGLAARIVPGAKWTTTASLRRGREDSREMFSSLASLYVRGVAVRWDTVMAESGRRIALPTYPFQRERHWVAPPADRLSGTTTAGHPLLGTRLALATAAGTHVWEREISLANQPWATDHRIQGAAVLPATAYIEMALQAGAEVLGDGPLSVSAIEVLKPMILHEHRGRLTQVTLTQDGADAQFVVHSRPSAAASAGVPLQWTTHVTARVARLETGSSCEGLAGLELARARCARESEGPVFYAAVAKQGNQWGPCFQGMERVWLGESEAVGRVRVAPSLVDDLPRYRFHPAVADSCGHALTATVMDRRDGAPDRAFVGRGVEEVRFYASPVGRTLWARATLRPQLDGPSNIVIGDVEVYDESGVLLTETRGARLYYLDESAGRDLLGVPDGWYYHVRWRRQPLEGDAARRPSDGPWLIFADESGIGAHIAARRQAAGLATVLVSKGDEWAFAAGRVTIRLGAAEDYRRLLSSIDAPSAILHLWSLDARRVDAADDLSAALAAGPEAIVHLLRAIRSTAAGSRGLRPRLWMVTAGVQPVLPNDGSAAPWNATLWGLGKSLAVEHAEVWGGLVDLPADVVADRDAPRLVLEIEGSTLEDTIALRADGRYVPRLEHGMSIRRDVAPFAIRSDATYLLTGGLGGIALAMAKWLAEQGATNLLLLGRTALPPRSAWEELDPDSPIGRRVAALRLIEGLGARVATLAIDVADDDAVRSGLRDWTDAGHPPIRGVIHAAGVLQLQALESQDTTALRAVLAAKVHGAWHLHRALGGQLEWFVFCSSTSVLLNSPLLGGYAAGNAFLDALAWHRRSAGLAALSVNWGTWGEVGMAVASGRSRDTLTGIGAIPTSQGLAALAELLDAGEVQAAVMPVDWDQFAAAYPGFTADPFFAEVVGEVRERRAPDRPGRLSRAALQDAAAASRPELVAAYLRTEAARVLGLAPDLLDPMMPLSSFGFDSLMAVQLKNRVETDLAAVLPMIAFLEGPSVGDLCATLLRTVDLNAASQELTSTAPAEVFEEGSL